MASEPHPYFDDASRKRPSSPAHDMRNMGAVSDDILLGIAGHASLHEILAMMQANKHVWKQLMLYEKSVVKSMLRKYPDILPPSGSIMCSMEPHDREVLVPYTYDTISELDLRRRRVDSIFKPGELFYKVIQESVPFEDLPPHEFDKVIHGFKHGCLILDRLGDLEADITWRHKHIPSSKRKHIDTQRCVRKAQLAYIRHTLNKTDHAWLYQVVSHAGQAYTHANPTDDNDPDADSEAWIKAFTFKEMLLRQGTYALWSLLGNRHLDTVTEVSKKEKKLRNHRRVCLEFLEISMKGVLMETEDWESGYTLIAADSAYSADFAAKSNGMDQLIDGSDKKEDESDNGVVLPSKNEDEGDNGGMLPSLHSIMMGSWLEKVGYSRRRGSLEADIAVLAEIRKKDG